MECDKIINQKKIQEKKKKEKDEFRHDTRILSGNGKMIKQQNTCFHF